MKHPVFTNANLILTYQDSLNGGGSVHLINGVYWQSSFSFCLDTSKIIGGKAAFLAWQRRKGLR